MNHQEIRFRILHTLYQHYYQGELETYHQVEKIIQEAELDSTNENEVKGDLLYLSKKNVIKGLFALNDGVPTQIHITAEGIDAVEEIVKQSMESIVSQGNVELQREIVEISKESQPSSKIKKFYEYTKSHPELVLKVVESTVSLVLGGGHQTTPMQSV